MSYDWKVAPMERDGTMPKPQGYTGTTLPSTTTREELFAGLMTWRWTMTVLCQYCGAFIRHIAASKEQNGLVSHGI